MIPAHLLGEQPFRRIGLFMFALFGVFSGQIRSAGLGVQGVDQLIQFVRNRRVHVARCVPRLSLNAQPSTLNQSGGLFSVAPVLRPLAVPEMPTQRRVNICQRR
jgi:hypothetical protein